MDLEAGSCFKPWQLRPWCGITIRIIDTQVLDVEPPPQGLNTEAGPLLWLE